MGSSIGNVQDDYALDILAKAVETSRVMTLKEDEGLLESLDYEPASHALRFHKDRESREVPGRMSHGEPSAGHTERRQEQIRRSSEEELYNAANTIDQRNLHVRDACTRA